MVSRLKRLALLVALACAALTACAPAAEYGATPVVRTATMHEGWEYRWGDSPRDAAGVFRWAVEPEPGAWHAQRFPDWPSGKPEGVHNLWQRIVLPQRAAGETLLLLGAWQLFEAYLDGVPLHAFGRIGDDGKGRFIGQAWHMIDLPPDAAGKTLAFRLYSGDHFVGLFEGARLGTRGDHLAWMLKRDLSLVVMGSVYVFLGLLTIFVFWRDRTQLVNVSFGMIASSIGVYQLCRTYVKQYLWHDPELWGNVELVSLYTVAFSTFWFVDHLFGPGPGKITRRCWQGWAAFIAVSGVLATIPGYSLWSTLYVFEYAYITTLILHAGLIWRLAINGNREAAFFLPGAIAVVGAASHDILVSLGYIAGIGVVNHIGVFCLVVSLALIVGRRYIAAIAVGRNLELASAVQSLLLPKQHEARFRDVAFGYRYQPAGRMSGDWLSFWRASDDEQRLVFGDVVGKGPQAALAVASIAALLEAGKAQGGTMEDAIRRVNTGLKQLFGGQALSTLSAIVIRPNGVVDLYNCGGIGFLVLGGETRRIMMPSSMLGFDDELSIATRSLRLEPGETLFAFTDGVAEGSKDVLRLQRALEAERARGASLPDLMKTAASFRAARATGDDRSIVALTRLDEAHAERSLG